MPGRRSRPRHQQVTGALELSRLHQPVLMLLRISATAAKRPHGPENETPDGDVRGFV